MDPTEQSLKTNESSNGNNDIGSNHHVNGSHNVITAQNDTVNVNNSLQTAINDGDELISAPILDSADESDGRKQFIINNDYDSQQKFEPELVKFNVLNEEISMDIGQPDIAQNRIHETV